MLDNAHYVAVMDMLHRQIKDLATNSMEGQRNGEEEEVARKMGGQKSESKTENKENNDASTTMKTQAYPDEMCRQCPNLFDDIGVDFSKIPD